MDPRSLIGPLLLVGAVACAGSPAVKPYAAVHRAVDERPSVLLEAVQQSAIAQGWEIVQVDPSEGVVELLEPLPEEGAATMRHRWWFQVEGGELRVAMRLEVRFDPTKDDRWVTSRVVCRGYEYLREEAQVARVLEMIPTATAVLAASTAPLAGKRRAGR